jgi:hypothetical protein
MKQKTFEEWKTEYVTKERIEDMVVQKNITEEKALKILNQTAEEYSKLIYFQPLTGPTGKIFKLKYRPTIEN